MKEDKLRLFIAIELPSNIIDGLRNVQEELKDKSNKSSWAKPENIHLTLKFLGDTETGKIDSMVNILEGIAGRSFSFEISVKGVGTFPAAGNPRVIWVGIEENKDMLQLYNNIEEGLAALGFEKERRDFKPHLTLGRIKFLNDRAGLKRRLEKVAGLNLGRFAVAGFALFKSTLTPEGAIHTRLKEYTLQITDKKLRG